MKRKQPPKDLHTIMMMHLQGDNWSDATYTYVDICLIAAWIIDTTIPQNDQILLNVEGTDQMCSCYFNCLMMT